LDSLTPATSSQSAQQALDALSSLARKISMARALGIYGTKMRSDLNWIRHIRNAFAHSKIHLEFATKEIADACDQLFIPKREIWGGLAGPKPDSPQCIANEIQRI
jgi:hypothetical protein